MGGDRPYTAEELAQRERYQRDPAFVEWLGRMDEELAKFFAEDVPDMPADPWTVEGLRHAEQAALAYYWEREPGDLSWRREREKRFQRYLGEVFVRNFQGTWMWVDVNRDGIKTPVVRRPSMETYFEVERHVGSAVGERSGEVWSRLFERAWEYHESWVAAGRSSPEEWFEYRVKHKP